MVLLCDAVTKADGEGPSQPSPSLRRNCVVQIISTILLSIIITIATIILSEQQSILAQRNREKDIDLARQQREQDIDLARQQREQDFDLANRTRMQTLKFEENRREQDRELANETRAQDLSIANAVRQDTIISTFIAEIGELLIKHNFSIDPVTRGMIIRPKMLVTFRQVDEPKRRRFLIEFLMESRLIIVGENPLDMTGIDLTGVDFSTNYDINDRRSEISKLSLVGAILTNASFVNRQMIRCNFSQTFADGTNFTGSILSYNFFYQASLRNAISVNSMFASSEYMGAKLNGAQFQAKYTKEAYNFDENPFPFIAAILPDGRKLRGPNLVLSGGAETVWTYDCYDFAKQPITENGYMRMKQIWIGDDDKVITIRYDTNESRKGCFFTAQPSKSFSQINQTIDMKQYANIIQYDRGHYLISAYMRSPPNTKSYILFECMNENRTQLRNHTLRATNNTVQDSIQLHRATRYITIQLIFEPTNNTSQTDITMIDDIGFKLFNLQE